MDMQSIVRFSLQREEAVRILRAQLARHRLDLVTAEVARDADGRSWHVSLVDDEGRGTVWAFDAHCPDAHSLVRPATAAEVGRRIVAAWYERSRTARRPHWTDRLEPGELALLRHPVDFSDPIPVLLYRLAYQRALYESLAIMAEPALAPPAGAPPSVPPPDAYVGVDDPPPCAPGECRWESFDHPFFGGFLAERCPICETSRTAPPSLSTEEPVP